ncbi:MAG: AAA family ATPase [Elainella sp. C42_A2020_010]|nr:AAA family ATPase [Elainella sp. C42_A2020_010]
MLDTCLLPGYHLTEVVHVGAETILYRGWSQSHQQPVILKTLKADYPNLSQLTRLKHEYQITASLDLEEIVKTYGLEIHQHRVVLVLEDFGGRSLNHWLAEQPGQPVDQPALIRWLEMAVQLAQALEVLHQHAIIHKDIKPANIIFNPATAQVKLTDFSIASHLRKEVPQLKHPDQLEGTLAYMSPEQTGRMNRSVDHRSDFYSLGVTFYEMLTGQLPFSGDDPLELVHCHIARQPVSIQVLNPAIPVVIAEIVSKLMAKNAEDRYQSATGLKADLECCLSHLKTSHTVPCFVPGARDRRAQFLIPQKLYGREAEVAMLLAAFDRVVGHTAKANQSSSNQAIASSTSLPQSELMLITGYSGIGKSSLVNEIHKPITQNRGYFISGKFDQFKRNIPYASLIQAFQSLIQQLMTESSARLQSWREKLLAALGANGQVIIDVIPEVELIIGPQPAVPELGATEAQNRLNRVFLSFIQVFTQPDHPLVLFLDDLQWADSASLKLIQLLMTHPDSRYLLLIGAYRDNEVDSVHPLIKTVTEIQQAGAVVNQIVIRPLALNHVQQLVADTLGDSQDGSQAGFQSGSQSNAYQALAELLFTKTQGNPFFLKQLLKTLYQEKLIRFDFAQGRWQWDLQTIQTTDIADKSVVELVASNIEKLPPPTQTVLKLAACVGDRFTIQGLATVSEMNLLSLAKTLQPALESGFILPFDNTYKIPLLFADSELAAFEFDHTSVAYRFLHDRVQQAAYSLIPESHRPATHLRVGQLLLQNTAPTDLEAAIFEIVNSLNKGAELLVEQTEKTKLARLNLIAGQKAKSAAAYEPAFSYLEQGIMLLAQDSWQSHYELTLALYAEAAEVAYLNTDYARSEQLVNGIEQYSITNLDKVKAYELKIQLYMAQLEMMKAIDTGMEALSMLGVPIVSQLEQNHFSIRLPQLAELDQIPLMTDPVKLAALRVLNTVTTTAYQTQAEIFRWIVLMQLQLCIEYGHSALAPFAYIAYGWFCSTINAPERAYTAGQIALKLAEQFDAKELECSIIQIFECFIRHQKEHIRETFAPLVEAIHLGLETGDIEYVSYAAMNYCNHLFFSGEPLDQLNSIQLQYVNLLLKLKQEFQIYYARFWRQVTLNLQGESRNPCRLIGESFDETVMLPRLQAAQNHQSLFGVYTARAILNYLFHNYAVAVENATLADRYASSGAGLVASIQHSFYYALILLARLDQVDATQQAEYRQVITEHHVLLQRWAEAAPMNYQHKLDLVVAELARSEQQVYQAMMGYDQAIQGALANGYIQDAAIASERAAEFYLSQNRKSIAQGYMTDAYYGYMQWGAIAKVQQLESRYPDLILRNYEALPDRNPVLLADTQPTRSTSTSSVILDLATAMKAAEAIASELLLEKLPCRILSIILENAAAQKGYLILNQQNQLCIEAMIAGNETVVALNSTPLEASPDVPVALINYVARTQYPLVLDNAAQEAMFSSDPYVQRYQPQSILCAPIFYQGEFIGIIYLENNLTLGAFTAERLELLKLLTAQAAIAIENARLYAREQERSHQLQASLEQLQHTQAQLVQTEKISQLGQLVAGVAHEVNNPIGFIAGNLSHAAEYIQDLVEHLQHYQQHYPTPGAAIQNHAEEIELEFLLEDLPQMIDSMKLGIDRIRDVMQSLRNYSRQDGKEKQWTDLHMGLNTTLMILSHRLKAKPDCPAIRVVKQYGELPPFKCYSGQLNQVFMNLIANAIDAIEEENVVRKTAGLKQKQNTITIRTAATDNGVEIHIVDDGPGIPLEIQQRLFDAFFTTKPEGKGTGLGLSISYQIVTQQHGGKLECISSPGQGTEFVIQLPVMDL